MQERPSEAFRDALYGKLLRQRLHHTERVQASGRHGWRLFGWMSSVVMACVILLVGSGFTTAYAYISSSVTRQSSLYALKMVVESAELSLNSTPEDRARALLKFAKRRIEELSVLTHQGSLDSETLAAIVHYTEDALAEANAINDTSLQTDTREFIAREAASQRAMLEAILGNYEYKNVTSDVSMPPGNETEAGETFAVFEETISKVGTVEVQALKQNLDQDPDESANEPNDLSLSFVSSPVRSLHREDTLTLGISLLSTGWSPIDEATVSIDWGDTNKESQQLSGITINPAPEHVFNHRYQQAGTYIVRVTVSSDQDEWTTANNRLSHTITVVGADPLCSFGDVRCEDEYTVSACGLTNGALTWKHDRTCRDGAQCRDGLCVAPDCRSTCMAEGSRQCGSDGKSFEICRRIGSCLQWQSGARCDTGCNAGVCTAKSSPCGNGMLDATEQCDDANTISGDGCSAQCTKEALCIDSDGGYNPNIYGTVKYGKEEEKDLCENLDTLLEFTCSSSQQAFANRINCPNGCLGGACKSSPACGNGKIEGTEQCDDGNTQSGDGCSKTCLVEYLYNNCIDSDGGEKASIQGKTSKGDVSSTDTCTSTNTLSEYFCRDNAIVSTTIRCANTCQLGACTPATNVCGNNIIETPETCDDGNTTSYDGCSNTCKTEIACNDSDGGSVAEKKGNITQGAIVSTDNCSSTTTLTEFICKTPYQSSSTSITCQYGCQNGACNLAPTPPSSVCGNGVVEGSEQCDDGNTMSEDGCNAMCQSENPKVTLRFKFFDQAMNTPVGGVHDYRNNQLQSDANGILTIEGSRLGISWIFEKGCYGYAFARIEKNVEGKALALIVEPFDGTKRVIDITGKNDVDVSVVSGNIPMYPFARFALTSDQPVSFSLSYDLKNSIGTIPLAQSQKTNYQFHPGIPRGYEAKNVQVTNASNTVLSCPSFTPSMTYDPSVCNAALLTVQGATCAWSEQ